MTPQEPDSTGAAPANRSGLRKLLQGAVRLAHELARPGTTACLVLDDAAENVVCLAAEGAHADELAGYRLALGQGVAGNVALSGELAASAGGALRPEWLVATRDAVGFEVTNVLCVPLIAGEDVFGALEVLNPTSPSGFPARGAELLSIVACRTAEAMEVASRLERMRHGFLKTVEHLADIVAAPDTAAHCHPRRALPLADAVAGRLGLSDEEARVVELAHILHDVGSASVGQELPYAPRELTENERAVVREHAVLGALLLDPLEETWMSGVVAGVRHHHERIDGEGYPGGLQGEAIPVAARIVAVVHAYLAMTEGRPYRAARTPEEAITELRRAAGSQFDPGVVEALAACVGNGTGRV